MDEMCKMCGVLPWIGGEIGKICVECHSDMVYKECSESEKFGWPKAFTKKIIDSLRSFCRDYEKRRGIEQPLFEDK